MRTRKVDFYDKLITTAFIVITCMAFLSAFMFLNNGHINSIGIVEHFVWGVLICISAIFAVVMLAFTFQMLTGRWSDPTGESDVSDETLIAVLSFLFLFFAAAPFIITNHAGTFVQVTSVIDMSVGALFVMMRVTGKPVIE